MQKMFFILGFTFLSPSCVLWNAVRPLNQQEEALFSLYETNAKRYYETGHYQSAKQQALKAAQIDSTDDLTMLLAWIHLKLDTRNDVWKAEAYFDEIDNGSLFSDPNWEAVLGRGLALRRQGDILLAGAQRNTQKKNEDLLLRLRAEADEKYKAAVEQFEHVLQLNPKNPNALDSLQQIYALQGDYAKSLVKGDEFQELASKSRKFWEEQLQREGISSEDKAAVQGKIASNLRREVASRGLAANLLFKQKNYTQALQQLDTLLKLNPDTSEEYFHRALCKVALTDNQGAVNDLQSFLEKTSLTEDSPQVLEAKQLLKNISNRTHIEIRGE